MQSDTLGICHSLLHFVQLTIQDFNATLEIRGVKCNTNKNEACFEVLVYSDNESIQG